MKQVGRYRILEETGRGAAGVVYKARDSAANRTVALKAIRPDTRVSDPSAPEAVRAMEVLTHPSIASIYEVLRQEQIYIVYEYAAGLPLETMLRRLALPEKPALLDCFSQVAQALDYADGKGCLHRDIKPSNILISEEAGRYRAKLTDYGVALFVGHELSGGAMIGTPSYLSPEEIQGMIVDGRSDQFSLAVVIYEVLCGTKPFVADNLPAIFYQICTQPARPVEQANPSLTAGVGQVLNRALAKSAAQRFPSATDFVDALRKALQDVPGWAPAIKEPSIERPKEPSALPTPKVFVAPPLAKPKIENAPVLPSLPRRAEHEATTEPKKRRTWSPLTLMAIMLVLSGLVIAVMTIFGQFNSRSSVEKKETVSRTAASVPTQEAQAAPSTAQLSPNVEVPKPVDSNPVTGPPPVPRTAKPAQSTRPLKLGAPRPKIAAPVPGALSAVDLLSEPPGATVIVDGNTATSCTAPCTISLPNGRHTATVEMNGYNVAKRVFTVPDEKMLNTPLSRSAGTLVVTSTPPGSSILIDNQPSGTTPATLHLSAGRHTLVLTNGSMQHEETIDIGAGELETRSLRWK